MSSNHSNLPVVERVAEAMRLLGHAWRGDWSDFDGRGLRDDMNDLADVLVRSDESFDLRRWAAGQSICWVSRKWARYCPDRGRSRELCFHIEDYWDVRREQSDETGTAG